MFWASLAGLIAFLASSMVSSFSFRAIQNGIAFFAVLGLLLVETDKHRARKRESTNLRLTWAHAAALLAVLTFGFSALKATGEYILLTAGRTDDMAKARRLCEQSLWLDRDNAQAWANCAGGIYKTDPAAAIPLLRTAIDRGLGVTPTYVSLADYHLKANDISGAKQAFDKGLSIFPNSVFLRIRYARMLEQNGETDAAKQQISIAGSIDGRQARGWYAMLTQGSVATYYLAKADPNVAAPDELSPKSIVPQYLDKATF